jgi:hypothetical protein
VHQNAELSLEAYRLSIDESGVLVAGNSQAGAFYGLQTLTQLLFSADLSAVPLLEIADRPDIPHRGVMLDVSRDRVPTMQTLRMLVDELASWKYNELQLYMEQTFAYQGHEEVWGDESPLTPEEIAELDQYCRDRYIDLVPHQNTLGHMHKWLENPSYAHLAENYPYAPVPFSGDVMHLGEPFWGQIPYSIAPTNPEAVGLVVGLLDELLPNFTSTKVNIGLDEPFDLATGQAKGAGDPVELYLAHVETLHRHLNSNGYTVQMWGDFIADHPESAYRLPEDIVVVDWGYWSSYPFQERAANLAAAGRRFYLATGTNAWCSIGGRTSETIAHMTTATDAALLHGAEGILVTDWGWYRYGTYQQHPISYLGFLYGAGESWSPHASRDVDFSLALSTFAFGDSSGELGRLAMEIGEICPGGGAAITSNSPLYWALREDLNWVRENSPLTMREVRDALIQLQSFDKALAEVESTRDDASTITAELLLTVRLLRHGALRTALALETDPMLAQSLRSQLASDLPELLGSFGQNWLGRYRIAGLAGTLESLHDLEADYGAGEVRL